MRGYCRRSIARFRPIDVLARLSSFVRFGDMENIQWRHTRGLVARDGCAARVDHLVRLVGSGNSLFQPAEFDEEGVRFGYCFT